MISHKNEREKYVTTMHKDTLFRGKKDTSFKFQYVRSRYVLKINEITGNFISLFSILEVRRTPPQQLEWNSLISGIKMTCLDISTIYQTWVNRVGVVPSFKSSENQKIHLLICDPSCSVRYDCLPVLLKFIWAWNTRLKRQAT